MFCVKRDELVAVVVARLMAFFPILDLPSFHIEPTANLRIVYPGLLKVSQYAEPSIFLRHVRTDGSPSRGVAALGGNPAPSPQVSKPLCDWLNLLIVAIASPRLTWPVEN